MEFHFGLAKHVAATAPATSELFEDSDIVRDALLIMARASPCYSGAGMSLERPPAIAKEVGKGLQESGPRSL